MVALCNILFLDAATSWMKAIPCTDSAVQGNDFELIPTIRMEREHSVYRGIKNRLAVASARIE